MHRGSMYALILLALYPSACLYLPDANDAKATAPTVVPALVVSEAPHAPTAPVALKDYFKTVRMPPFSSSQAPYLSFSSDEKHVAYVAGTSSLDIWVKPVVGDGKAVQVSHGDGARGGFLPAIQAFAFSPKDDLLVWAAGGRIYSTKAEGGPAKELVPGSGDLAESRRTGFVQWAKDGKSFLYLSNSRDVAALDLLEYDIKTAKSTMVWQADGNDAFVLISPNHRTVIVAKMSSGSNMDLWAVERGSKLAPKLLTKHEGDANFAAIAFSPDAKSVLLISDEGGEFAKLLSVDLATAKRTPVLEEKWDVERAGFSNTQRYLWTEVNENGTPRLTVTEKGKSTVALPAPPGKGAAWSVLGFSPSDRYLGATLVSDTTPAVSYVIDLKEGKLSRILDPLPDTLRDRPMIAGEGVEIPSFDGKKIPAILFKPPGKGPFPAIVDVHDEPSGQVTRAYSPFRQYALSKGYVVLTPNVRGSSGYGKSYVKLDNLDLGGGPLKDLVACKKWLVKNAAVADDKVVVFGKGYGGYMALAASVFTPNEFAANVDLFGYANLKTLSESFPPSYAAMAPYLHQKFGDPKNPEHADYQHDRSPIHFVDKMVRPLLLIRSTRETRFERAESAEIVAALTARKMPIHSSKLEDGVEALELTDLFLDRYIFGDIRVSALP